MKKSFSAAFTYMIIGVLAGLFYREFTKANDFPEGEFTQLAVVHTHLLTLGFIVMLLVLALDKLFGLSGSRLFSWFFWLYNVGIVLTVGMMIWHGSLTVLGEESNAMIAGIAGLGHIALSVSLVLFFLALRKKVVNGRAVTAE
ncbi:DUF2871 domain-containing protein [Brevibacterium sp. CFH 10365]|uniref:DUF2871 domain-containing protein n=1 Tax=Brevibacterium sp. CFH 10365 TaxID=2585207 RepID=UPI00126630E4|nr:DUF2871 domain-containing protein [Brevibacterium sp. CFH 10365]